jgi:hypothetical protein
MSTLFSVTYIITQVIALWDIYILGTLLRPADDSERVGS